MTKRHPAIVVLLTFMTFTLYAYYWLFRTTRELEEETGREDLNPAMDVLLTVVTLGFWGIWAAYRNARIVHQEMEDRGEAHVDRSLAVAGFAALTVTTGWAWLVSMFLLQEDYNRLAEADLDVFADDAPAYEARPVAARVVTEPPVREVSSVQVFESSAPMPVVY